MDRIKTVTGYTLAPWEHALPALRIAGPIRRAGLELIQGNQILDIHPERVSEGDVVVVQREFPQCAQAFDQIRDLARAEGKPLIIDLDDLLLELPESHPDRQSQVYARALLPVLGAVAGAGAVTASTKPLCDYLRQFNPNTWLLPNYLDDGLWALSEPRQAEKTPLVIGYMGGDSHREDLQSVAGPLLAVLDRFSVKVMLRFWGAKPPSALLERPEVEWLPLEIHNYDEFARYFQGQEVDVFIAPLVDNRFNRCKSAIKFLEYSALGAPGVYSRVAPYEQVVTHGENGFLAAGPQDWVDHLSRLVEDPELRYRMGLQAQATVRRDWLLSENAHRWPEVYRRAVEAALSPRRESPPLVESVLYIAAQVQAWQASVERRLQEKEQEAQTLSAELANIYQSRSWAVLQKLLRWRRRLARKPK